MGGRLVSPTFIGRREALGAALELLRRAGRGAAGTLLAGGEAGIGKTRFTATVAEAAGAEGYLVLRGTAVRVASGELPYAPIAAVLRDIARSLGPEELAAVEGNDGPILDRIVSSGDEATSNAAAEPLARARSRLFRALLGVLDRLAERRPVLVAIEDLHWADSASLDVLDFFIRSIAEERVALLLTFRSDDLHRRHPLRAWLGEIERLDILERLQLEPFSEAETRELIAAIRGSAPAPELVEAIQARADGNPFFIEELLAVDAAGGADLTTSLRDVLQARVASVPEDAQPLLRVAAVIGRHADAELLADVAGLSPGALDHDLQAAIERQVLVHEPGTTDRFMFRHALIQEVVEDALLPGERIRLHRAVADALARRLDPAGAAEPGRWAELADHWDAAHNEPRTFEASLRAAAEAVRAYAFGAALARYRRALAGWELVADPETLAGFDRVELLSRAAEVAWLAGAIGPDQIGLLREAIAEADRRDDAVRGALLRGRLGYALWVTGEPREARVVYEAAVAHLPPGPATSERAWLVARLAQALMLEASNRESLRLAESALAMAREAGDQRIESHALNTLACAASELGHGGEAIEAIERAMTIAEVLREPDEVGRAYLNATEILATSGLDHRALELVWQVMDRTAELGIAPVWGSLIGIHGAVVAYDLGRWSEAAELAGSVLEPSGSGPNTEVYVLARIVPLAVGSGRWEVAREQLDRISVLLEGFDAEAQYSGPFATASAEVALWQAMPSDAMTAVNDGLTRLERTDDVRHRVRLRRLGIRAAADLAVVARDRHDPAAEAAALADAAAVRDRTDAVVARVAEMDGGLALELAAETATVAAEASRLRGVADPPAWREVEARWSARERPYLRGYTCWREAEACLAVGDRSGATEALRAAVAIADQLGARPLGDEVAALARRARIQVGDRRPSVSGSAPQEDRGALLAQAEFGLTHRELDVLDLLAQGLTNRQIADALFISVYTAGVHVSRILGKLDVASRTEAASKAYRLGIVLHQAAGGSADHTEADVHRPVGQVRPLA